MLHWIKEWLNEWLGWRARLVNTGEGGHILAVLILKKFTPEVPAWLQETHLVMSWCSWLAGHPYLCLSRGQSYPGDSHYPWLILFIKNSNHHELTSKKLNSRTWIYIFFLFRDKRKADLFSTSELIPARGDPCWIKDSREIHGLLNSKSFLLKFCIVLYKQVLWAKAKSNSKRSFKTRPGSRQNIPHCACKQIKLSNLNFPLHLP